MKWLQDKKNLPIVIALFVVVMGGVGFVLFKMMKGPEMPAMQPTTTTSVPAQDAQPQMTGTPGGQPQVQTAAVPAGGTPGAGTPAQGAPAAGSTTPKPKEDWVADPFLPRGWHPPVKVKKYVEVRVRIPAVPRIFLPPPPKIKSDITTYLSQPPRRVAGIIYSQRVSALLQTPDGWETVRPGDKLRDGTRVERIERDRVILRTNDETPRLIEVKLAAAAIMGGAAMTPKSGGSSYSPGSGNM